MFTGFHTTNKGQQYIAKATAGKTLVLTKGQFGNGELPEGTAITAMTTLASPISSMPISKKRTMNNSLIITTQFSNRVNGMIIEPFFFMEAGIFGKVMNADGTEDEDAPETLLLYANALNTEKADYIPGILTEFILNWPLTISETSSVTVEINESMIYPTMEEFNQRAPVKVTAEGTGETLEINSDETLKDGLQLSITLSKDLEENQTIVYNGGESVPIYNANGTLVTKGQQVAGTTMNVVYNESEGKWYIVGGGAVEIATESEAKAGTNDTKMMTPKKVTLYVNEVLGNVNKILDDINGEVV